MLVIQVNNPDQPLHIIIILWTLLRKGLRLQSLYLFLLLRSILCCLLQTARRLVAHIRIATARIRKYRDSGQTPTWYTPRLLSSLQSPVSTTQLRRPRKTTSSDNSLQGIRKKNTKLPARTHCRTVCRKFAGTFSFHYYSPECLLLRGPGLANQIRLSLQRRRLCGTVVATAPKSERSGKQAWQSGKE